MSPVLCVHRGVSLLQFFTTAAIINVHAADEAIRQIKTFPLQILAIKNKKEADITQSDVARPLCYTLSLGFRGNLLL